jgi:hypothetical protein
MQKIIGIAGRKSAGKDTTKNFILGAFLVNLGISKSFSILENNSLYISDIDGDTDFAGIFDYNNQSLSMQTFLYERLDPYIKIFCFSDLLKKEVCIKILGLTYNQCFGTNDDKNSLTNLYWEDMPGVCIYQDECNQVNEILSSNPLIYHAPGKMTAREVLQFVGTNLFRKIYSDVWVNATLSRIQAEGSEVAIITDARFPNEVEGINAIGGKTIYLTRNPYNDQHESETALDPENFDHQKFTSIIDNKDMSITQQNNAIHQWMKEQKILAVDLDVK